MRKEGPLEKVISEKEFISKLGKREQSFFAVGDLLMEERELSQRYYSKLETEAHNLETFLDNHRARGNRSFIYFTELVASIRWFANAIHTLKHILNRYSRYGLRSNERFFTDMQKTIKFCNLSLVKLYKALREEALSLGVKVSPPRLKEEEFVEGEVQECLPQNIDEIYCLVEGEKITEVTFQYVDAAEKLSELVEKNTLTEDRIEEVMSTFHRIQSKYDSYISGGKEEKKDKRISLFRGYTSISLHLLEVIFYLFHFYERHAREEISEVKRKISEIIDAGEVNKKIILLLNYAKLYALEGNKLARKLLKDYADVTLAREKVIIPKGSILHLRPASALVEPVIQSTSPVLLEIDGKRVRANSVLEIIAAMGEVADKIEENDVEMVLQGDQKVVRKMKENFLSKIVDQSKV